MRLEPRRPVRVLNQAKEPKKGKLVVRLLLMPWILTRWGRFDAWVRHSYGDKTFGIHLVCPCGG